MRILSVVFCVLGAIGASLASAREPLNVLIWEDFIDPDVLTEWTQKTGIPVQQTYYDDESERDLILAGKSASYFDVVIVNESAVNQMGEAGYLHSLKVNDKHWREFWPQACGSYGVPYLWGTYGIIYRKDKVQAPVRSWKELLSPREELTGHIGMLGQPDELLTSAFLALGYPVDSNNQTHLEDAFELLREQSKHVFNYEYIYSYIADNPESDDIWAAPAYSGDAASLNELQNKDVWEFVKPKEGLTVWVDCWAIVASSSRVDDAQKFINFMSRDEISAKSSEAMYAASPFKDAVLIQNPDFQEDTTVYLTEKELELANLFPSFSGNDMLQRLRIRDALIRYYDTH